MRQYFREIDDMLQSTLLPAPVASIVFGDYPAPDEPGQDTIEVTMAWYQLGDRLMPRLECYQDAFRAFAEFREVLDELSTLIPEALPPDRFCRLLNRLGFTDISDTLGNSPYPEGR